MRRTAGCMEQRDVHIPLLTVRETLDFAARCQGAAHRPGTHCSGDLSVTTLWYKCRRGALAGALMWSCTAPATSQGSACVAQGAIRNTSDQLEALP